MTDIPIIDAHQHFWDLSMNKHPWLCGKQMIPFRYGDYSSIRRTYLPDDYFVDSKAFNIVKTIHMEAEWDPKDPLGESEWLMQIHEKTGFPNAIIGQAWFLSEDIDEVLRAHAKCPLIRSVRQKPFAAASPGEFHPGLTGSMTDPAFRAGYANLETYGLHFDLQTPWWHLREAAELAHDFPETTIILNHTGLPSDRSEAGLGGWMEGMKALAAQPNTSVKISGICVPGQKWTAEFNRKVVLDTIQVFGVERCMFSSNFPVDGVVASFDEIVNGFAGIVSVFSEADQLRLFHDNALKYYQPV